MAIKAKMAVFMTWLVPFVMSVFTDRHFISPSSRFVHFIAGNSAVAAAAIVAMTVLFFSKSLQKKSYKNIFWILLGMDSLTTGLIAITANNGLAHFGRVGLAIAGEEANLY